MAIEGPRAEVLRACVRQALARLGGSAGFDPEALGALMNGAGDLFPTSDLTAYEVLEALREVDAATHAAVLEMLMEVYLSVAEADEALDDLEDTADELARLAGCRCAPGDDEPCGSCRDATDEVGWV